MVIEHILEINLNAIHLMLISREKAMNEIQEYDVVALIEDTQAIHKETKQLILLKRGQVGTIIMSFDKKAYLIDFADSQGNTYAMETVSSSKLMHLIYKPTLTYA